VWKFTNLDDTERLFRIVRCFMRFLLPPTYRKSILQNDRNELIIKMNLTKLQFFRFVQLVQRN